MALDGKIGVVTGAANGIGKAITEILVKNGAKVALLDVNETAGKSLMKALEQQYGRERALFLNCDVESEKLFKAVFQKTFRGIIDILCNNAGILNENLWEKTVSINLASNKLGTCLALEHMSKLSGGRGGVIVNTASMADLSHHRLSERLKMALSGKVGVVTGAAMGIGKAITEILVKNGAKVALLDVNETAGKSLVEALQEQYGRDRALFLNCDVESEEQFKAAFQKTTETFGGIDILCNNAGILNENLWEKTVSINLMGAIRGTYLALKHMSKLSGGRGGVIVNTASMAGLGPLPSCPVYTATKHGVVGFTRATAAAYTASGYGIRVNALCPGFVQTDLFSGIPTRLGPYSHLADATEQLVDKIGIITVNVVAEALLELVTDETKNGEALLMFPKGNKYVTFPSFV